MKKNNINEDPEVYVDNLPIADGEIFAHIFGGQEPRRIKMKLSELKAIKRFATVGLITILLIGGIGSYPMIKEEYNKYSSLNNIYNSFIKQVDKYPSKMFNSNY